MAKKNVITIDGVIGPYGFSQQYIKHLLDQCDVKDEVTVNLRSLGGSLAHALAIRDMFAQHNVVADLTGFNASSSTVISTGAKKVRMSAYSFYLVHKVSIPVDVWGMLNEDDISEVIKKLEKAKDQNVMFDLEVARMYMDKTGKSIKELTALMKENKWINAETAKKWGFVDEIYKAKASDKEVQNSQLDMIAASGYPMPEMPNFPDNDSNDLFSRVKSFLSISNNSNQMDKFKLINSILGVDKINAVDGNGVLNDTQLTTIENKLKELATAKRDAKLANEAKKSAESKLQAAENARDNAASAVEHFNALDKLDDSIKNADTSEKKAAAIKNLLNNTPGAGAQGEEGGADGGHQETTIGNADPINEELVNYL